jgi:hypothetical protein
MKRSSLSFKMGLDLFCIGSFFVTFLLIAGKIGLYGE